MFKLLVPFLFLCGGALAGTTHVIVDSMSVGTSAPNLLDANNAGKAEPWTGTQTGNGNDKGALVIPAYRVFHVFNGITTTDTGRWVDTRLFKTAQIIVTCAPAGGVGTGATLYVSGTADYAGAGTTPSHATHGVDIGSAIVVGLTSNRTTVVGLDNYTKLRIDAQDTATVYADIVFRAQ